MAHARPSASINFIPCSFHLKKLDFINVNSNLYLKAFIEQPGRHISYEPKYGRYLILGFSKFVLVSLANLPKYR